MGQEDIAVHLQAWERVRAARLRHLQFHLTEPQLNVVEEAIERALDDVQSGSDEGPNRRSTALAAICRNYLAGEG